MMPKRWSEWVDSKFRGITQNSRNQGVVRDFTNRKAKILGRLRSYTRLSWHMWRRGVPARDLLRTQFPQIDPNPRRPALITAEFTNHCNLRCVYCNSPLDQRPRGFMAGETFERLLDGLRLLEVSRVRVVGSGEPTLHPEFPRFIRALSKTVPFVSVLTNGQWKSPREVIEPILDAPIGMVEISVSGGDKEVYEKSRQGGLFERLIENLTMLKATKRTSRCRTITNIRLMLRPSEQTAEKRLTAFWRQYADCVMPQYVFALKRSTYREDIYMPRQWDNPSYPNCSATFKAMNVEWNGDVPLCSFSAEQTGTAGLVVGNVGTDTLGNLWNGNLMRQYREGHRKREADKMAICKGCTAC
jgi:MoaA/NifB/PqqE/SkfB family radical SAM enzyme